MDEYYFITFESTNHALSAEDYLKKNDYSITIIPTPTEVTQSCGLSIKFNSGCISKIKELIDGGSIRTKSIYHLKRENGIRNIEKVG